MQIQILMSKNKYIIIEIKEQLRKNLKSYDKI